VPDADPPAAAAPPLREFRFRPRFRALPWATIVLGAAIVVYAFVAGGSSRTLLVAVGVVGPVLGGFYLLAPAWRFRVLVDDDKLAVRFGDEPRFELAWSQVVKVVHTPESRTCWVDGGETGKSLLLPGPGAPGPYRIERREELYDFILAHVPADRRVEVAALRSWKPDEPRGK
jgi:hypothetical protein